VEESAAKEVKMFVVLMTLLTISASRSAAPRARPALAHQARAHTLGAHTLRGVGAATPRAGRAAARMLDVETLRSIGPAGMAAAICLADMIPGAPTQPISITTGALFGFQEGLACVSFGQACATALALTLARSPAAKSVLSKAENLLQSPGPLKKSLDTIATTINSQSFVGVVGTIIGVRQSPVIPFSLGNYYLGLFTNAPLPAVVAGTVVGCLPLNALWVYVGSTTSGALAAILAGEQVDVGSILSSPAGEALEGVGGLATAGLAFVLYRTLQNQAADADADAE
jgi:uncharacterized membrane protein YdjX (TVP38/TMEM64 family)